MYLWGEKETSLFLSDTKRTKNVFSPPPPTHYLMVSFALVNVNYSRHSTFYSFSQISSLAIHTMYPVFCLTIKSLIGVLTG